ncbi:hypothetical protein, partial [Microbulbifer thermotolerans]
LELAGGVVGKFQLFAVGQCGGDAVASGVVVVGDFGLALPVGDEAKEGFLFLWVSRNVILIPTQNLDFILGPIAEHKQRFFKGIESLLLLDDGRQAVDGFAHIHPVSVEVNSGVML